jgi:hypothetical protein
MKTEKRDNCKNPHPLTFWYAVHPAGGGNGEDRQTTSCREHGRAILEALKAEHGDRYHLLRVDDSDPRQK